MKTIWNFQRPKPCSLPHLWRLCNH